MMSSTDQKILNTLAQIEPASVEELSSALSDDQGSIRQKLQRLRRYGLIIVAQRKQIASRIKCYYALAPKEEQPDRFNGFLSQEEIKKFRESIKRTPWAGMASLV